MVKALCLLLNMAQLYPKTVKLRIKRLNVSLAPFACANGASLMQNVSGINAKNLIKTLLYITTIMNCYL